MPNLRQIYTLKNHFFELNISDSTVKDYLEKIEAADVIRKAFNSGRLAERSGEVKMLSYLTENLNPKQPELIKYFEKELEEDVALLFIDINSFSKVISGWSNAKIKNYLDLYYQEIIPLIYQHGGEIEKLMGDGIICVFGPPFLDKQHPQYVYNAEACAEAVIKKFYSTSRSVKVAIHNGPITYYKVPSEHYGEYTIIGQPITDLYRLESVSKPNTINFFTDSLYDKLAWTNSRFDTMDTSKVVVNCTAFNINPLQGVDFNQIKCITFNGYL